MSASKYNFHNKRDGATVLYYVSYKETPEESCIHVSQGQTAFQNLGCVGKSTANAARRRGGMVLTALLIGTDQ